MKRIIEVVKQKSATFQKLYVSHRISHIERSKYLFAILLTSLYIAVTIPYLSATGMFSDEAQTIFQIKREISKIVFEYSLRQQNAPFYFIVMHYWGAIFGYTIENIRLFSILCVALSGGLMFLFSWKYQGRIAAFAMGILFFFIQIFTDYALEARGYAFMSLIALVSGFSLWNFIQTKSNKFLVVLTIANLLLLYTHYLTIYILVGEGICVLFLMEDRRSKWLAVLSFSITGVLFFPWFLKVVNIIKATNESWRIGASWPHLLNHLYGFTASREMGKGVAFVILLSIILVMVRPNKKGNRLFYFLFVCSVGAVVMNYAVSHIRPVFLPKYTIYAFFFFLLFVVQVLKQFPTLIGILLFGIFLQHISARHHHFTRRTEDWRSAANQVILTQNEKNVVLVQSYFFYKAFLYYYDRDYLNKTFDDYTMYPPDKGLYFVSDFVKYKEPLGTHDVILVQCKERGADPDSNVFKAILQYQTLDSVVQPCRDIKVNYFSRINSD